MGSLSVRAPLVSCLLFVVFLAISDAQVPPGVPEITGTQVIILNKTVTLTCTATGGDPSPSVTWLRDNTVIDDTYTQVGDSVINNYTFVASSREHLAVFECQSANGVLQNPLSRTKFVEVYQPPTTPIITGPTTILSGTPGVWTCFTKGAYPAPKMIMRIENEEFDNTKFTAGSPKFDRANSNYNLTGTLNWSPTMANNNQRIYCDVEHTQTLTAPKTTSLLLTVGSPLEVNAPQPTYKTLTGETITLQCVVTSGTATQIRWFKNNQLLNLGANSRLSGATPTNPSLTIAGVVMSDADNYICQATDGSTTKNTTVINVTVRSKPTTPELTGPTSVQSGTPTTWTCVSRGGNPLQTMSMRIGNQVFTNEVTTSSVLDPQTNTYTVTGTLQWAPTSVDNDGTLYCDVTHPETLNAPQTVDLPLRVVTPPQPPTLTGPTNVKAGTSYTWTCRSVGAFPEQTMSLRLGSTPITNGLTLDSQFNQATKLYTVTRTLTWTPTSSTTGSTLFCDVLHPETLGQTPQTANLPLSVQSQPQTPTLTGPSEVVAGNPETWTCVSKGGNPSPTMSMRIGNTVFNQDASFTSVLDPTTNSYTVTGTLQWAPSREHNQQVLHCDVSHPETLGDTPQTVDLPLKVLSQPQTPTLTGPSEVVAGNPKTWTCVSKGGNPSPTMSLRIGNTVFNQDASFTSVLDPTTNSYTVTGTLQWAPSQEHNQQVLHCDVSHPETLGDTPQTVDLPLKVLSQPQTPTLTGPSEVVAGNPETWTCVSKGGNPSPTMSMRIGNTVFNQDASFTSVLDPTTNSYTVTGTLQWAPSREHNQQVLHCDVSHPETLGDTPQTVDLPLKVLSQPQTPTLTGPLAVISGTTRTWTCVSIGGNPAPTMTMRIGNTALSNQLTVSSVLEPSSNTYRVTGTLTWAPTSVNNQQTLFCDVSHPETLGNTPQTVSQPLTVYTPPNNPQIAGPSSVVSGKQSTWTCVSVGAYPEQSMSMRIGSTPLNNGFVGKSEYNLVSNLYTMTGTLTWSPSSNNDQDTLFCDVTHPETLQTPQTAALPLTVETSPLTPTLTGPSTVISGTTRVWTCISTGGNPEPTMSIRIGNTVLSNELTVASVFDQTTRTYRVTGTLSWAPSSVHNQQTMFCDVRHDTLNAPQTVSLPLTVHTTPRNPVLTGPEDVVAGKEYKWTCVSTGAYPEQTMRMRVGSSSITNGFATMSSYDSVSKLYTMTGVLTWSPSSDNNDDSLFCDVFHTQTLGQTPQTASLTLSVTSSPIQPTLTGPSTVTSGTTNTWTCVSTGGNPEPSMSMRIGNDVFSNGITFTSVLDPTTNTYRVTGTLSWAPGSHHNQMTLFCDVTHDTLTRPQTVNLPLTVLTPPRLPQLTGPTLVVSGREEKWTCVSVGAYPEQTMSMRLGGNSITQGFVTSSDYNAVTKLYTMTGTLTWTPTSNNNQPTLFCDVFHTQTLGQTPQTTSLQLNVQTSPQIPTISGPTTVISGTTTTWTCVSTGGNPEPTMSIRIGNNVFSSEVNVNSVLDQQSNTYRVTGTLTWAPESYHNQMTIFCDVEQPATMDRPQTVSLPLTVITSPRPPVLRGPSTVEAGEQYTWTCTSAGANPEQTMSMRLGSNAIQQGFSSYAEYDVTSKLYTVTGTLLWTPSGNNNEDTLFCDVFHTETLGQTPQTASLQLLVQTKPNKPTLTGPTTVTAGTSNTWTCLSIGGNPEPEMSMRINNRVFSQEVTVTSVYDQSSKSFRVTGTLNWAPSSQFNQETLYCDVLHEETSDRLQTVNLPLTVISPPNAPVISGPSTIQAGKQTTWTCTSTGAFPVQTMSMRLGGTSITDGFVTSAEYNAGSKLYTVTGTLTWSPTRANNGDTLFCDVFHSPTLGNSPLTASKILDVQNSPQTPQLTGPTTVTAGTSNSWTCVSEGGNPEPSMAIRYENMYFNSEVTTTSTYDDTSKSYRVVGTLTWAPSSMHNLQSLYCEVSHPETLGNTKQIVNLPLTVLSPPRPPVLTGPSNVRAGSPSKWTCTSVGAYPEQTMRMRLGSTEITQGFYTMSEYNAYTKQFMVIGTLEWSPSSNNHGDTLFCDVTHQQTLGQTPQTASLQLSVQASPQTPTLTGPTTTISGTTYSWTCVSLGGFPEASMTMRVGNMVFNNEVQVSSQFDQTARSYRVTGTLSWSPTSRYNGETIYCDVTHETLGDAVQTVSRPLVVYTPPSAPVLSGPTTVTSGNSNTWTCVSTGAYPEQQMSMRIGNTPINSGLTYNAVYDSIQKVYKVTGTLVWSPATVNNGDTLFCDVTHTETASPTQTDSLGLTIYTTPQHPILSGPTKMVAGTSRTWTCVSIGGFPQQQMSMRIGATDLSNSLTVNAVFDSNTKLYRVTGTLVWAPSVSHDGEVLSCDVYHRETLGDVPQTVSLRELDVQAALSVAVPKTSYSPKEDEDVTLQCVVTSGVATSISWTKNNVALQVASSDRFSGATPNDPSLTISGVTLADQGNYVCSATDGMSSDSSATVAVQPIEKVWTEHVIITYILNGYNKLVRPRDPLFNITHNLVPRHFLQFDGRNLTMQAMQCMKWNDPRLTWPKGQNKVSLPASEIWIPDVVLLGEKYVPDFSTKVSVTKDGNVIYCPQGPIMASDCEETAGEVHECKFKFLSWSYDLVMLDIHLPNTKSIDSLIDLSMFVEHDTLEISSRCAVRNEMTYSCRDGTYAELTYTLSVRRRRQFCRNYNKNPSCN